MKNIYPCEQIISVAHHNANTCMTFAETKAIIWDYCERYPKHKGKPHPHGEWTRLDWQSLMENMKFCNDKRNGQRYELGLDEYKAMSEFFLAKAQLRPHPNGKIHDYSMKHFFSGGIRGNCYYQAVIKPRK
ncbi:MAG: hypothetical protein FWE16_02140 [Firmicutes bacterium]|nr:hypothetical protein [Bacillota bacterium]